MRGLRKRKGFLVSHFRGLYLQSGSPLQGYRGYRAAISLQDNGGDCNCFSKQMDVRREAVFCRQE